MDVNCRLVLQYALKGLLEKVHLAIQEFSQVFCSVHARITVVIGLLQQTLIS